MSQAEQPVVPNDNRVTAEMVNEMLSRITYHTESRPLGSTSTIVHAFLDGKFLLASGTSGCVDPANFDADIGYKIAATKAIYAAKERIWDYMGFQLYLQQNSLKEQANG